MPAWPPTARHPSKSEWGQDPRRILEVRKLYAVGILVYFAAGGILAISISDFSDWASFMGRHAVYASRLAGSRGRRDQFLAGAERAATVAALMSPRLRGGVLIVAAPCGQAPARVEFSEFLLNQIRAVRSGFY